MSDVGTRQRFFSGSAYEPVVGYARAVAALADPALRAEIEAGAVVPDA